MAEKITYSYLESLIERQNRVEQEMLAAWENGSFTFRHPFIRVNPYLINPLAAVICFETEEEQAVTLTVFGKEEAETLPIPSPRQRNTSFRCWDCMQITGIKCRSGFTRGRAAWWRFRWDL